MITANEIVAFEHGNIRRIAVVNAVSGGQRPPYVKARRMLFDLRDYFGRRA